MKLLLKYPSRERPELFEKTVREWTRLADEPDRFQWLVSLDADDPSLPIYRSKCDGFDIEPIVGVSRNKIDATNRDLDAVRALEWDVLILVSDDMRPVKQGWDTIVRNEMTVLDMALWFVDGRRADLCTLSMFGRPIFEQMKCVYHPEFETVYSDNYFQFVMEHQAKMKRVSMPVFEHQWKVENNDALMARNESRPAYLRDMKTHEKLKAKYLKTGEAWPN